MEVPEIRFANAPDGVRIAYQTWGAGPTLVIVPALISHIEMAWESELFRRCFERLGRHLRVVQFDKRGIGLSDRFDESPTPTQRIADFTAVMDAEGIERAAIGGVSEGGVMALLFAAEHPDRVDKVVVTNTASPVRYWDRLERLGSPNRLSVGELHQRWQAVADGWASDPVLMVDWIAPGLRDNESVVRWTARFQRLAATREGVRRQIDSVFELDAGDAPERVTAPTLILHSRGDQVLDVGHGRILDELIPDSRLIELDNSDHFWWYSADWRQFADAHIEFVTGAPVHDVTSRRFGAVLFTDMVDSTTSATTVGDSHWHDTLDSHTRICEREVAAVGGQVVKSTGDGVLALFDSPSPAIEAARAMRQELLGLGVRIRAGVHAGEVELHESGDISGLAVNLAARVEQAAPDGEILVSSTVRDLLLGGSHAFEEVGEHDLKGITGRWTLCRLV